MKYLLGFDVGSSSVKVALLDAATGKIVAHAHSPAMEMQISSPEEGFAEQDPEMWWAELLLATQKIRAQVAYQPEEIAAIGISYQMHGLVCIDADRQVLRPAIIWCDSRAVATGNTAFAALGESFCLHHFLNSPGNFTASKLKWIKDNEPGTFKKIHSFFLPGDFIAMKLTGEITTTISGLSEGILWDYPAHSVAGSLLSYYGIDASLLARIVPVFGEQGRVTAASGALLGIAAGTPVAYRAGDQPNNAYSLKALHPGEVAANAGTSGVVYGITDRAITDQRSRVNPFVHVTHLPDAPRYGVLLCVNGTGSLNSWLRRQVFPGITYEQINQEAATAPIGSDGLFIYPFGNGAERMLQNSDQGAGIHGLRFNRHSRAHVARAAQEGIVFAMQYGMEIMRGMGMDLHTIRAGNANMFLSDLFATSFANTTGCTLELYDADGAGGAARAAGVGAGLYADHSEGFSGLGRTREINPDPTQQEQLATAYTQWKQHLTT